MTPMKEFGISFKIFCVIFLGVITGCKNYKFFQNGTVVNASNTYYINTSERFSIVLPGDFANYNDSKKVGCRVDKLYPIDKEILSALHYDLKGVKIYFSGKPQIEPYYHLIALEPIRKPDIKSYKLSESPIPYYFKTTTLKGFEIFQALIIGKDKIFELIYYNNSTTQCHNCDMKDIAENNAKRSNFGYLYNFDDEQSICTGTDSLAVLSFRIPPTFLAKNKYAKVILNKFDPDGKSKKFETFKILTPNTDSCSVPVCKGKYEIRYTDFDNVFLYSIIKGTN